MKTLSLLLTVGLLPCFGAANLSMLSATLSAGGTSIAIPITGGACPSCTLSPASGITGFSLSVPGGWSGSISGATSSGNVVTLVITEPISVDESPTVSLSGGNLTDGSGDTPAGQSGFTVSKSGSEWHGANGASMSGKFQAEGAGGSPSSYTFQLQFLSADGCYRINATASQVDLFAYNNSNIWQIRQDGVPIRTYTQVTANTYTEQGLITGLSGTHEYDFCQNNPQSQAFFYSALARIRVTGTIGSQPTVKPIIMAGGDSIAACYGPQAITDSTTCDAYQGAQALGAADQYWGSPGDQLCSSMDTQIPAALAYITGSFPFLTLAGSTDYNDYAASTSAATVGNCMNTLLTGIDALSDPPTHVLVFGNLPFVSPIPSTYDTALATAVASHSRACFVSRLSWINTTAWNGTTGDRQSDQIHITGGDLSGSPLPVVGYAKVVNRWLPIAQGYMNGSSFSVSGTTTGTVSVALTLGLPGASTFQDQITVTSSNPSDRLTLAGTLGTGSVTLPANLGTNTAALNITGPAGTRTISYSTSLPQCWTAPAATPVTLTQGTATPTFILLGRK